MSPQASAWLRDVQSSSGEAEITAIPIIGRARSGIAAVRKRGFDIVSIYVED
jgi:hypothetical protein